MHPSYEVVRSLPDFELRRYRPYAVVETTAAGKFDHSGNAAFRRLFEYISGGNGRKLKIEMVVPVMWKPAGQQLEMTAMQFVLPARFDASTAPSPAEPSICVRDIGMQLIAARRFAGRASESNCLQNEAELFTALQDTGLIPADTSRFAVYNRPFTPWFMRRNEVLMPVDVIEA